MKKKNFIRHRTGFICHYCKTSNAPANQTERNHCRVCLSSQHLDESTPGDRASACCGKMVLQEIQYKSGVFFRGLFVCQKCKKQHWNKFADDDSRDFLADFAKKRASQNI